VDGMRLLFHACCAPCAAYPITKLRGDRSTEVVGFWFNPNVHPFEEYRRRLETLKRWASSADVDVIYDERYPLEEYLRGALDFEAAGGERCRFCYRVRLEETARVASREGFDAFSTSLLVSPYQKHSVVAEEGERAAAGADVPFHYADLRPLWKESVRMSKERGMYRQPYCGCVFSERDRYAPRSP